MKKQVWRGQFRAPLDLINWAKGQASDRFMTLNAVLVEALREYKENKEGEARRD